MEVKGTAVKSVINFVSKKYNSQYKEWYRTLPKASQDLLGGVVTSGWYNIEPAIIEPTKHMGKMFFQGQEQKAAWEAGKYSADVALNGIYKFYVRATTPAHIISRGGRIMSAYYRPAKLEVPVKRPNSIQVEVTEFDQPNHILEHRIGGWIERALEISGCKELTVSITQSHANGDPKTVYMCKWR